MEHAEYLAMERIRDLDEQVTCDVRVEKDGTYPGLDEFLAKYKPIKNPTDPTAALNGAMLDQREDWDIVRQAAPESVWTIVECEGLWWISPGLHFVNRIGYLVTEEWRNGDRNDYLCE